MALLSVKRRNEFSFLGTESHTAINIESKIKELLSLLIPDQKHDYDTILHRIVSQSGGFLFLDAPGGTGKTFLTNLLLAKVRSQRKFVLAIASSGIAATLLNGGRTAHSTFKLPLNLSHDDTPVCNIKKGSGIATVLERCHLIVRDECTMSHKRASPIPHFPI